MNRGFKSFKEDFGRKLGPVLRHVLPRALENPDGVVCQGFENIGDAVGLPPDLLDPDVEVDRVVLMMSLICNDTLDAVWVVDQMERGRSVAQMPTPYEGVRVARRGWAERVLASITHEALITLDKHAALLDSDPEIIAAVESLLGENAAAWRGLRAMAKESRKDRLRHFFVRLRNNFSYHYEDTKPLGCGYHRFFRETPSSDFNRWAYISIGNKMNGMRFHFADAAVQAGTATLLEEVGEDAGGELTKVAAMMVNGMFNLVLKFMERRLASRK